MPSKKAYDLVPDDGYECRVPLHSDDAFQKGVKFQAKYVGSMDIPKPSSRLEIVAAMRRIRFEFKAKAIKKKKITLIISIEGVKTMLRKKKKSQSLLDENKACVLQHQIFRIFYVSHDSQDLKIWSYIARESPNNTFKCSVFKANKKSHAMRIVRTIGQAFEVCHKMGDYSRLVSVAKDASIDDKSLENNNILSKSAETVYHEKKSIDNNSNCGDVRNNFHKPDSTHDITPNLVSPLVWVDDCAAAAASGCDETHLPLSQHHRMQLVRYQLDQQNHQTQVAVAQVHLLKDQLSAEIEARIRAQTTAHQLLLHNKDLFDHVSLLANQIQHLEVKVTGVTPSILDTSSDAPQASYLRATTTPRPTFVYLPNLKPTNSFSERDILGGASTFTNKNIAGIDVGSPDSGHKEMSSESLSYCLNGADASSWYNPYCLFSLASSQQPSCHDSINSCFVTPTAHLTPAPPISYPITSKITNSAVSNNSNSYANNTSIPNVSHSNTELSRYQNVYEVFSSQSPLHKTNLSDKSQLESLILSPSSSKLNRIEHEPSPQVIFPAPLPSSSSTVTAPLCGGGAKLDPPPQFRRTIRPIESRGQGSWLDVSLDQLPESNTSQKDVGIDMDIGQF